MSKDLMLDVDQASELKMAFRRGDYNNAEIKKLSEGDFLKRVRDVLLGRAEIKAIEHLIDCDAKPFTPSGWEVLPDEEQLLKRICGNLKFDSQEISLYLSKKQSKGTIYGNDLRKELANKTVLKANVLDYLLAHTELIPEEWKGKYVFFWGTIYRCADGDLYVRYLYWTGSQWDWGCHWLGDGFGSGGRAALAS